MGIQDIGKFYDGRPPSLRDTHSKNEMQWTERCASEFKDKTKSIIKVGNALEKLTFCLAKRAEKNATLPRCDCITKFIFAITVRKQLYLQM
jgi:hypothetical protein